MSIDHRSKAPPGALPSLRVRLAAAAGAIALACASHAAQAITVTIAATSNPWLAGMPDGTQAISADSAPAHSPVLVGGLDLGLGGFLGFVNASGGANNAGGCPPACDPVDGGGFISHSGGAEFGISGLNAPINSLLGVFLTDVQPDLSPAPQALNFGPASLGVDFMSLAPELKQVFFIGDGMSADGVVQRFGIPDGATRLYLGTHDGFGWFNNSGSITVDVIQAPIPEPETYALMLAGLGLVGWSLRRRASSKR